MTDIRDEVASALSDWVRRAGRERAEDALLRLFAARGLTVVREGELDVERLADSLTAAHLRRDGYCSESHRDEARFVADDYAARFTRQPEGQLCEGKLDVERLPLNEYGRVECICGRTVLPQNWANHLLTVSYPAAGHEPLPDYGGRHRLARQPEGPR
jgi:hypothetical protein